jgi:hypothetical protein
LSSKTTKAFERLLRSGLHLAATCETDMTKADGAS